METQKKWYCRQYSSYNKPRSIITMDTYYANSKKEALAIFAKVHCTAGSYCTAVISKESS
jgi:hypothetical protein